MRTLIAALSVFSLIILLTACPPSVQRCDHFYDANCGNLCPEGCPDTTCCGSGDVDTCSVDYCNGGCCCEEGVECLTDTCANIPGFVCIGCCCEEGVDCKTDTCRPKGLCGRITWEAVYGAGGDDEGWGVIKTSDGNYVVTGRYGDTDNNNDNVLLVKFNRANGISIWGRNTIYGNNDDEYGTDLMELAGGDLIIQGNKQKGGTNWQFFLIRTESDGIDKWKADNFGLSQVDLGFSVVPRTDSDGFLMYGYSGTYQALAQLESIVYEAYADGGDGTRKNIGESQDDYGSCIEVAHDGHYLLLTTIGKATGGSKLMLYKLHQNLNDVIWQTEIISNCIPEQRASVRKIGTEVAASGKPSYVVAGAAVTGDVRISRISASGDVIDFVSYPDIQTSQSVSVIPTKDGGFAFLADNMTLAKIKWNFEKDWKKEFDGEARGVHSLIQDDEDGGFVMTGLRNNGSDNDLLIIKTDSLGVVDPQ